MFSVVKRSAPLIKNTNIVSTKNNQLYSTHRLLQNSRNFRRKVKYSPKLYSENITTLIRERDELKLKLTTYENDFKNFKNDINACKPVFFIICAFTGIGIAKFITGR
ncbi:hypothetical protein qu_365 [Acanthamoeba polyphaga mimivirus]|nr:hypothetical protein [Mimivirus reunion]WMV61700.1 hypothetical protein qu_365 [Mimivirus sp.]WMV62677.1 hypothetical protein qu_365 [Acanthamoeba polyphaga mimivirus]WMV63654.1 hypothetical protein qu_365 [Mimivirus sp.]